MNVLWLAWKDPGHPEAGGAELVAQEISHRLVRDGHQVTLLTCGYDGAEVTEIREGINIVRVGNQRHLHSFQALFYYMRHLRGRFDVLIEEVNGGAPYFSVLFEKRARKFVLYHQLARINWLHEMKPPLSLIGYYGLVPAATKLVSLAQTPVITVSESTRQVLAAHGFQPERTHIISEGLAIDPVPDLKEVRKYKRPTLLSLGAMRAMKRTVDHIAAFEVAKREMPDLQLKIAGKSTGEYGRQVIERIESSQFANDIEYLGMVSRKEKIALMRQAHLILQTAVEEGWGLTITEAASQGTPAVAYDVSGLRDSVKDGRTGTLTPESPELLGEAAVRLLSDTTYYERIREAAWRWSKRITFEQCYRDFINVVETA